MDKIRLLIVDDHRLFVDGLSDIFEKEEQLEVAGICYTGESVYRQLQEKEVEMVLLDLQIKNVNGLDICAYIRERYPDVKVIILSMFGEESFITKALQKGAHGYLLKNAGKEELLKAIRLVADGHNYYSQEVTTTIMNSLKGDSSAKSGGGFHTPRLSKREKQVLGLIVDEHTTNEIAEKLFISQKTVESHRSNLLTKLDVRNTAGLVRKALELKLLH